MKRVEIVRQIMESKSIKVSDIAKFSELPYSTVKYILENGIEKANYCNVLKICAAIGITADELECMLNGAPETVPEFKITANEYTEIEIEKVRNYAEYLKQNRKEPFTSYEEAVEFLKSRGMLAAFDGGRLSHETTIQMANILR